MEVSWDTLNAQIAACDKCALCQGIHHKVPGQGNGNAELMFIGEGPGAEEDLQGLAFVGPAGQLLTKMLAGPVWDSIHPSRPSVCRPLPK